MSIGAAAQVLPSLADIRSTPYTLIVEGMHLRWVSFTLRAAGWLGTLHAGGSVRDTGLFVFLLSFIGWCAAVWLMWWLLRRNLAFTGVLPLFILMAINGHLSRQNRVVLLAFAAFSLLAIIRSAYTGAHEDWNRRNIEYAGDLALDWGMGGAVSITIILSFAWLFSYIGTPAGWQVLANIVEQSRRQMSDTANQLFGGVKPPPVESENGEPFYPLAEVNTPNLVEIGSPISQGSEALFWVWTSDPPPLPEGVGGVLRQTGSDRSHYWRSMIYGEYTGRGWQTIPLAAEIATPQPSPDALPGRYLLNQRFEIVTRHQGFLFAVSDPVYVDGDTTLRQVLPDKSQVIEGGASTYSVTSQANDVTIRQMETAGSDYSAGMRAIYLQLPTTLPHRIVELANAVVAGASLPYQKAVRIQNYLRATYPYNLSVAPAPPDHDVVDYFLFEAKGGFCTYYATAMTVLLRAQGVPARVVAGYAMGSYDQSRQMYRVPASASHAWVEVYFPGYGWVEFEPTPAYAEITHPLGVASPGDNQPSVPVEPPGFNKPGLHQFVWLLIPVGLAAVLSGVYFLIRAEQKRRAAPGALAVRLYERVRRGLAFAGIPFHFSQTPEEYASQVTPSLVGYPRLSWAVDQATRVFIQAAYTHRQPRTEDVIQGEKLWMRSHIELIVLLIRVRLHTRS
jgi:hypothetical protein